MYAKQYLYPALTGLFCPGKGKYIIKADDNIIAPAICYELSNKQHIDYAFQKGANIYMASVLNSVNGVDSDLNKLSQIASSYNLVTFMSNYVGVSGGYECAGISSVWNTDGVIIAQLDGVEEGMIVYDTFTGKTEQLK